MGGGERNIQISIFCDQCFICLVEYYLSMLYHFEQVYYFRKEEPSVSVADPANRNVSDSAAEHANDDSAATNQCSMSYNLEDGNSLVGTIDAKFDYSYVITVNLGSGEYKWCTVSYTCITKSIPKG